MIDDRDEGEEKGAESGLLLLQAVQAIAISPADAAALVSNYRRQSDEAHPNYSSERHQNRVADKIVSRYARLAGFSGGLTGLAGSIPGIGTAIAIIGGGTIDTAVCMKLQVDMCMCLAAAFGYDITKEDTKHLAFLISAGATVEQVVTTTGTRIASEAGVRMLRQYLKGAALVAVKQAFRRIGIVFTRKAAEKALPFGIGVAVGSSTNYALAKYVGSQAKGWFILDRDMPR